MQEERQTKFSNQILYNLFKDYSVTDIRILSAMTNRLLTKHKAITDSTDSVENESILDIGISLRFFNKYKGKKRLSVKEIDEILKKISSFGVQTLEDGLHRRINLVNQTTYDEKYKSFKITFNENAMEYLILIYDKFTLLDLNIIKDLNSKYDLGLYILMQMFKKTGYIRHNIESLKEYFNTGGSTNDLMKYLKGASLKLNDKFNYNIKIEYEKQGRKIDKVIIKFRR